MLHRIVIPGDRPVLFRFGCRQPHSFLRMLVPALASLQFAIVPPALGQRATPIPAAQTGANTAAADDAVLLNFAIAHKLLAEPNGTPIRQKRGWIGQAETEPLAPLSEGLSFPWQRRRHRAKGDREAFDDFARRNSKAVTTPALSPGFTVTPLPASAIARAFKPDGWYSFYKAHPNVAGILRVSLPGYSADRATALVLVSYSSNGKSGTGILALMHKKPDGWHTVEEVGGWMH